MNIWFCNQSKQWLVERRNNLVCATDEYGTKKFRRSVRGVKKGDIVVHYHGDRGYSAISRAAEDAIEHKSLPVLEGEDDSYGHGWRFKTEYHDFELPIDRRDVLHNLKEIEIQDWPFDKNGNVKRGLYFNAFSKEGLGIIRQASRETWPEWAESALNSKGSNVYSRSVESFNEGGKGTSVATLRDPKLRKAAMKHWSLNCYCCGFNFELFYGNEGKDRAIVHHLETFRGLNRETRDSTVEDVRVVCANCHFVVHFTDPPEPVDQLKNRLAKSWTGWTQQGIEKS